MSDGIEVVATAATGSAAVEIVLRERPEVVLMDLGMPNMDGVEATRQIREQAPEVRVVALTGFDDDESIVAVLQAGASGYLTKDAGREAILHAVQAARLNQSVLDTSVQRRLVELARSARTTEVLHCEMLTNRECEVLHAIGSGLRDHEIARQLFISEATVKTHINNLFSKAGLTSRADAVRYALALESQSGRDEQKWTPGRDG